MGAIEKLLASPRVAIATGVGVLVVCVYIAWAIYVGASRGFNAGLGTALAWPLMVAALALIAAPLAGAGVLVRRAVLGRRQGRAGPSDEPGVAAPDDEGGEPEAGTGAA